MEIHHKVTVHLQKLCQHLVRKLRCKNLKIRNGSYRSTHLKVFSILKYEAVIHNIRLDTFQLRSCFPDILCFNTKRNILGTHQTIISFRQLIIKHLCKLHTQIIKLILLRIDMDNLFILRHVAVLIDKGKLKMNRAVKII